ncbi:hypothetical protein MMC09_003230 [Bachmanniomyces sp. S44760]|nr:hypothetical protein [Bachmanniomyces sp. S44760]
MNTKLSLISLALLISSAFATPIPGPSPSPDTKPSLPTSNEPATKRDNAGSCSLNDHGIWRDWTVNIPHDAKYDQDCGRGFLDNLRGDCGVISSWKCDFDPQDQTTAVLNFATDAGCDSSKVQKAIGQASGNDLTISCV